LKNLLSKLLLLATPNSQQNQIFNYDRIGLGQNIKIVLTFACNQNQPHSIGHNHESLALSQSFDALAVSTTQNTKLPTYHLQQIKDNS